MSTARDLILEIKRRLGGVNTPVPDETDVLAYLNGALAAIWNYGARLNSPVLYVSKLLSSASGSVTVAGGIQRIKSVRDHETGTLIPSVPLDYAVAMSSSTGGGRVYVRKPTGIDVYPLNMAITADAVYMPFYARLAHREDESPFPAELDNDVIALAAAMIKGAEPDMVMAQRQYGNALSRYFRPGGPDTVVCRGPW